MKLLLDESADFPLGAFLTERGHDVIAVAHDYPAALKDREGRIIITNDRDFGELVFRQRLPMRVSFSSAWAMRTCPAR